VVITTIIGLPWGTLSAPTPLGTLPKEEWMQTVSSFRGCQKSANRGKLGVNRAIIWQQMSVESECLFGYSEPNPPHMSGFKESIY
jgi:hypothetical protein